MYKYKYIIGATLSPFSVLYKFLLNVISLELIPNY